MRKVGKDFPRRDTPLFLTMLVQAQANMGEEAVNEEMYDSLKRATTTATSLDAEHDRGNISKTQSKATPNELSSLGTSSVCGPRRQDTMGDTIAQTRSKNVSKQSNGPPLSRVNTLRKDQGRFNDQEMFDTDVFNDEEVIVEDINSFVPMDSEVVKDKAMITQESSSKRAGDKLEQERSKKQKVEDDKESEELNRCLEIILDDGDDVTIDSTPLSIKTSITDYKIYKEGKKSYF
nr:hypothetical protein [Tanacetum cinerariifolium]